MSRGYQSQSGDRNTLFSSLSSARSSSDRHGHSGHDHGEWKREGTSREFSQSREDLRAKKRRKNSCERPEEKNGSDLPSKLFECMGEVVLYQEMLRCGILRVSGSDNKSVYCFFINTHCIGYFPFKQGARVTTNARLVTACAKVPYMAASVWQHGERASERVMDALLAPAYPDDLEKYFKLSEDLSFGLDDLRVQKEIHNSTEKRRSSQRSSGMEVGDTETHKRNVSPKTRYEAFETCKIIPDFVPHFPIEHMEVSRRSNFALCNITEEYSDRGVRAVVDKYLSKHTGQLSLINSNNRKTQQVLFHVNQVWMVHAFGHSQFLETHTLEELESLLKIGKEVTLNARRISGCNYPLQATAIWTTKDPPPNYKTSDLLADLSLRLNDQIYSQTGEAKFLTNPLAGAPDCTVSAKVQEYFSQEMGFLQLDSGDRGVVLFHLNQVWSEGSRRVLYNTMQDIMLDKYLPIGSSVMVNIRKIPAHTNSSLRYQATLVWKKHQEEAHTQQMLPEYIEKYKPHEERACLVKELNNHHDNLKNMLNLHKSVYNFSFAPVHAVLNGLPNQWMAEVVAVVSDEFGIIKISHQSGNKIGPRVHMLYAMFHIEDVFDAHGVSAILSCNLSMNNLLKCQVDLTARPICTKSEPDKILEMQSMLADENRDFSGIPLLQAVVVCVKISPNSPINFNTIPKPTRLRDHPGSFGQKLTEYYLNASLGCKLDIKLRKFLAIPNKLNLPYERVMKNIGRVGRVDEKKILTELEKIDVNNSSKFVYGGLPRILPKLPKSVQPHMMPKILTNQKVQPLFLHRTHFKSDCGIVELEFEISGGLSFERVRTLAFFELSRYKFFSKPDCFATDLANIMPISSQDNFFIHAQLAYPGSDIPYVALAIWNEDLRKDIGADCPMDFRHDQRYVDSCQRIVSEIVDICQTPKKKDERSSDDMPVSYLPIPEHIGRVTKDVKHFDKTKVLMDKGEIQEIIHSQTGMVEKVLSDHLAVLTFKKTDSSNQIFRVLCSSDDVFILDMKDTHFDKEDFKIKNKIRFASAPELWKKTARFQQISLFGLLKPGQKVRFNALPLLSNDPNNAEIHYCTAGVLVTKHFQSIPVPVNCVGSSKNLTDEFKIYFMKVLRKLNSNAECEVELDLKEPPEKFPASFKKGKQGKMSIRLEYLSGETLSKVLPNPVRVKKAPLEPVVWQNIINDVYGKVIRIIDRNYGIGAGFVSAGPNTTECVPFQILFDTFDVFVDDQDCNELGKKLSDVMNVGDYIKFNAVMVETEVKDSLRDIKYMTTALIVAKTVDDLKEMSIPTTAARILSLDQVTPTKIDNFKVVVGVMNNTTFTEKESQLLEELRSGEVANKFCTPPPQNSPADDVLQVSDESDDEVMVLEDEIQEDQTGKENILEELKPSELRKIIMSYMEVVAKQPENKSKRKIKVEEVANITKIEKDSKFFEDFFLYLAKQCKKAIKGIKIGHVFVTQAQVNMIKTRGIMNVEDIDRGNDNDEVEDNICSLFSSQDLRKVLLNFMKLIQKTVTLEHIAKECNISMDEAEQLLVAITKACKEAPRVEGKAKGVKLQNIFINSTWVDKITHFNFDGK